MYKFALIGGTGIGDVLLRRAQGSVQIPTKYGLVKAKRLQVSLGADVLLLARHGAGHKVPPHGIAYRAMAEALDRLNIEHCFSSTAVGSLKAEHSSGKILIPKDFIDLTGRNITMFEEHVEHKDFSEGFDEKARNCLVLSARELNLEFEDGGVYVGANGPRYETASEVQYMSMIGGDVVGMTASSEATVMREAGIRYASVSVVTNFATGIGGMLSHEEVVDTMKERSEVVANLLINGGKFIEQATADN